MAVDQDVSSRDGGVQQRPLVVPSIPDLIYDALRRDIGQGSLQPGPLRLRDLAERFGVSPIPVREALRRLEADGLVSFTGNRAIRVNSVSREDLVEVFAIRRELESLAVRLATPTLAGDAAAIDRLEALIATMDKREGDVEAWRAANEEFHSTLYEAAGAPRLSAIIRPLWTSVEPYLRMYVSAVPSLRLAQDQHRALLDCIRAADADGADRILREHLGETEQVVLEKLEPADAGAPLAN